jgi:uncharacterized SAM-binding protein YcdF (DUF218 family)
VTPEILSLAKRLWDYHHMRHELAPADVAIVLCSHDLAVAERGAQVFLEGWAPTLVFSGGLGVITRHLWTEPEADKFAAVAVGLGVPPERILIENASTNTGENVDFTRRLLEGLHISLHRAIVVQKPYMERRAFATFKKRWPELEIVLTSPQVSFEAYLAKYTHAALSEDDVISIMVGDLQRIQTYPERGFQIPQEIPEDVKEAYSALIAAGYDRHLAAAAGVEKNR